MTTYRFSNENDIAVLAQMNAELIHDEGHRTRMTMPELEGRMATWLGEGYVAVLFEESESPVGYALFKPEPEWVYLRQFFVAPEYRRRGIGKSAMQWLRTNPWKRQERARLDVLIGNVEGIAFWRSLGFQDYCVTMEMSLDAD